MKTIKIVMESKVVSMGILLPCVGTIQNIGCLSRKP